MIMSDNDSDSSSPSNPSSPASHASSVLTPRRKVQALLAQFSDSESEDASPAARSKAFKPPTFANETHQQVTESEEDDVVPPSRLTARLMADTTMNDSNTAQSTHKASEESSSHTKLHTTVLNARLVTADSSEDELAINAPTRRLLNKRKASSTHEVDSPKRRARSTSPLFFSSPPSEAGPEMVNTLQTATKTASEKPTVSSTDGRERFLALVAKQRKQRLEREAAEIAKRAAGGDSSPEPARKRGQRGSSPANDVDSESGSSDNEAAKKISKQAPPTRKASKKALEEMHRETQRMNRNMQLAHQARTKKKITKESLLARFNFVPISTPSLAASAEKSSVASSTAPSGDESVEEQTTPPTSPLQESPKPLHEKLVSIVESNNDFVMTGALASDDELPGMTDVLSQRDTSRGECFRRNYLMNSKTVSSPEHQKSINPTKMMIQESETPTSTEVRATRISLARAFKPTQADSDSDSDLDIVTDRGSKRKYAAFEGLTKRKAHEKPSHLALRSLAHLMTNDDKKKSMNAAEMESSLRKAARLQALAERRQRIEELKAKGVIIQTAEERERDQQEVEDLVERARQEAVEIQKREKELAKKDGTYVKDDLDDDDDDSGDEDFEQEDEAEVLVSDEDSDEDEEDDDVEKPDKEGVFDDEVEEGESEEEAAAGEDDGSDDGQHAENADLAIDIDDNLSKTFVTPSVPRGSRRNLIISDDEEDQVENVLLQEDKQTPKLPSAAKTPHSGLWSAKKIIPGLQMSDDLPMGLSQAFAATMAESQGNGLEGSQEQDSFDLTAGLPTPRFAPIPSLQRLDSVDLVSDSLPASQTQPLNVDLSFPQSQMVPESPARGLGISGTQVVPSQVLPFDLTQDAGYMFSPFKGSRFAETPKQDLPHSTVETVILPAEVEHSPLVQRKGRLRRGRVDEPDDSQDRAQSETVFQVMKDAAKRKAEVRFDKSKSDARGHFDEAAEESEDEYAGLGGASDDDGDDEENEEDRKMIDEDTQVGRNDEAKLAGLYADRERERDEKEVSKLLKDITTGALRRKRGVGDDLDLSDEEDEAARRREAKRREFAKMRRELLKDEAVGKIAEDKKKEAFLRSIEDRDAVDEEDEDDDPAEMPETQEESQEQSQAIETTMGDSQVEPQSGQKRKRPLEAASDHRLNRLPPGLRRTGQALNKKPATLAEIRESVSFLIDEPDSQAATVDLGLSDSDDDEEAYVNLDRHFQDAENDENAQEDDADDLGDFVVDDEPYINTRDDSQDDILFKKPDLPSSKSRERAPYSQRRTQRADVVDRLSLLRQRSSSASSSASLNPNSSSTNKMAFFSAKPSSSFTAPTLLRRATTNSSLGSVSAANISSTGVTTSDHKNTISSKTERGNAAEEKEFIRKGKNTGRNAVNFQARSTLKEEKMAERDQDRNSDKRGGRKTKGGGKGGFLGGLFRGDSWE